MLKVEYIPIESVKPYQGNVKRHPRKQIDQIKESIKQFGFNDPIAIDARGTIIEGHGRYQALTELGYKEIPVIKLEGLTEAQRKAYTIVHNKLTMDTDFDLKKLRLELSKMPTMKIDMDFKLDKRFNNERERTFNNYNLDYFDSLRCTGKWQMPSLEACHVIPENLIGFNYLLSFNSVNKSQTGIHFFIDDYQFERIWNSPAEYIDKLAGFQCVLTPDFSLYMDMPMAMKIWNIYRSRIIGQIMQDVGINVIPTVSWAEHTTYSFCFDGMPEGGVVATSSVGVMTDPEALKVWKSGMNEMIKRLKPEAILIYGNSLPNFDYKGIPIKTYCNLVTAKMKTIKNRKEAI